MLNLQQWSSDKLNSSMALIKMITILKLNATIYSMILDKLLLQSKSDNRTAKICDKLISS